VRNGFLKSMAERWLKSADELIGFSDGPARELKAAERAEFGTCRMPR
jgi:hypothetical protein